MKDFYTTAQVARLLGVTAPTVIKWIREGRVAASTTPGGHRRIPASEVARWRADSERRNASPSVGGRARVLILDTELDFADMVAEYLILQGDFVARSAVNPVAIGFELGDFRPNIVLCAMELPIFGSVVSHASRINARLVLMTNGPARVPLRDGLDGCSVIEKPVQLETLLRTIQDL